MRSPKLKQEQSSVRVSLTPALEEVAGGGGPSRGFGVLAPSDRVSLEGSLQKRQKRRSRKWSMFPSWLPQRSQEEALRICTEYGAWMEVIGRPEKVAVSQSAWQVFARGWG